MPGTSDGEQAGMDQPPTMQPTPVVDTTAPRVSVEQAEGQPDPTALGELHFTVVFDEPVGGFDASDIVISGPAHDPHVTGSGPSYDVSVLATGFGTVSVSLEAGAATDAAGNASAASTSADNHVTVVDGPSVTIVQAATQADPTNEATLHYTVEFSQTVTGFDASDIVVTGPASNPVVTGSDSSYTVTVTATGDGVVRVGVAQNAAANSTGSPNVASTSSDDSITFDGTAPGVTVTQSATQSDPTNAATIHFTVEFSEPVIGFDASDVLIEGDADTPLVTGGGTTFDVAVTAISDGLIRVRIPASAAQDAVGNNSRASTSADDAVTYDATQPTVTITQSVAQSDPTNVSTLHFTAVFSEPVNGFNADDVQITGPAHSASVSGSGTTYEVTVTATSSGAVTVGIAAGVATDDAGNFTLASTSSDDTVSYDDTAPTVTINQAPAQADPTNSSTISFKVLFSEPVTGFGTSDLVISANAGSPTITGSGTSYDVQVTAVDQGAVSVSVAAGGVIDVAGNTNAASTSTDAAVTFDSVKPSVTIEQASSQADPTATSPILFSVAFSENVTGFSVAALTLVVTAGLDIIGTPVIGGSGSEYTVSVQVSGTGTISASVKANSASDAAGNGNSTSTSTDAAVSVGHTPTAIALNLPNGFLVPGVHLAGQVAARLSATDPDASETHTFALAAGGTDNASFTLAANGDLTPQFTPNSAVKASYQIRVTATDSLGLSLTSTIDAPVTTGSSYRFSTCGVGSGASGPTQAQCNAAYSATSLSGLVNVPSGAGGAGYQLFTVPAAGAYYIQAGGARGGDSSPFVGGNGARMGGVFTLAANDTLAIVVGQRGVATSNTAPGGGGGTFVSVYDASATSTWVYNAQKVRLLLAAGGGGGGRCSTGRNGISAESGTSATTNGGGQSCGGSDGAGGCGNGWAAGGAGFSGNGNGARAPLSFLNGASGGDRDCTSSGSGGFGGGAGGNFCSYDMCGAGGGYSGGGAPVPFPGEAQTGGAGGSFNSGTWQTNVTGATTSEGAVLLVQLQ